MGRRIRVSIIGMGILAVVGCATTRSTDTSRSATEMLLVSDAVDKAVDQLDFQPLQNQTVFLDTQYLDSAVDKGYLISSIRQALASSGALLQEKAEFATYIVEVRSGCVGTDRYSVLVGVPQMQLPTIMPGQPSFIPEIPLIKKTDQLGVAKLGVFIYHRETGRSIWQSGTREGGSSAKDTWVLGAGPIQRGSVNSKEGAKLAGMDVKDLNPFAGDSQSIQPDRVSVTASTEWSFPSQQPPQTRIASEPKEKDESKENADIVPVSSQEPELPPPAPFPNMPE